MVCSKCNKEITGKVYPDCQCQTCYKYFNAGGKVYALPPKGRIVRDDKDRMICHICGRSFNRIGSHAREFHHMTIKEYKERFGLCAGSKTSSKRYITNMRKRALSHINVDTLISNGVNTRFSNTHSPRLNTKARLEECYNKSVAQRIRYGGIDYEEE